MGRAMALQWRASSKFFLVPTYLRKGLLKRTVENWGDKGKVLLPDLLDLPRLPFAFTFAALLTVFLYFLEHAFPG